MRGVGGCASPRPRTGETGRSLELPILPALQKIIEASPTRDLTFLVSDLGRPFTGAGFGNKMRQWCDEAGLPHCLGARAPQGRRSYCRRKRGDGA
jgi:hypothetical protein